jgi:hypothetical protein
MFLNPRQDLFKFRFPSTVVKPKIYEKYNAYLAQVPRVQDDIVAALNESIQGLTLPGVGYTPITQTATRAPGYVKSAQNIISSESVQALMDKTITITIRHTEAYLTYFLMLEVFYDAYDFTTPMKSRTFGTFPVQTLNLAGNPIYTILFKDILFTSISELSLSYTQTDRSFQTFDCTFMFSTFDTTFEIPSLKLTT